MKPSARIQAGIDILSQAHLSRVPMDTVIGDYMRHRRYIGSKDRAAIAERAYHMMRSYARIAWWLTRLEAEDTPRNRMIFWLALGEGADSKRLDDLFEETKYAPNRIDEKEADYIKALVGQDLEHGDMPEAVKCECPPNHEAALRDYFGDDFAAEMTAMLTPATLDLRVNSFLAPREKVKNYLEADGVETTETPYSPWGLRCAKKAFLSRTKAFNKGWIEIQDEGSQLIAHLCDAQPGMQVMDFCAGAGGKTLALGSAMERKGRIVAMDNDERRLNKGRERYKKAQLADMIEVRSLQDSQQTKWLKRQKGKFDIVLLDVPCSGTGTWRRNPDMRWRTYGPRIEELTAIQAEILQRAAPLVKPGGKLVYATCSLLPAENEKQVEAFLKENADFTTQPLDVALGLGSPYMRLTPHRHNTDGFFAAVMIKS